MSDDALALIDYKALGPAESTGWTGFSIGVIGSYLPIDAGSDWQKVTGKDYSGIALVGGQVTKGLPLDLDVGAFYTVVPDTSVVVYGGELRWALLEGSTTQPALALRGSYSKVTGINRLELDSKAVDLSLSKGFTIFTPYVGAGYVWGTATPDSSTLMHEHRSETVKGFVGLRITLGFFGLTPEVEQVGDRTLYNLKFAFAI
jgi:hypothetical protein